MIGRRTAMPLLCALVLTGGALTGPAHVHESADHHAEPRGLHLDHAHLDHRHAHGHGHAHDHADDHHRTAPDATGAAPAPGGARHVGHHQGDAVYLGGWATRSLEDARIAPALVTTASIATRPERSGAPLARDRPVPPRAPPQKIPPRLRAPPA